MRRALYGTRVAYFRAHEKTKRSGTVSRHLVKLKKKIRKRKWDKGRRSCDNVGLAQHANTNEHNSSVQQAATFNTRRSAFFLWETLAITQPRTVLCWWKTVTRKEAASISLDAVQLHRLSLIHPAAVGKRVKKEENIYKTTSGRLSNRQGSGRWMEASLWLTKDLARWMDLSQHKIYFSSVASAISLRIEINGENVGKAANESDLRPRETNKCEQEEEEKRSRRIRGDVPLCRGENWKETLPCVKGIVSTFSLSIDSYAYLDIF